MASRGPGRDPEENKIMTGPEVAQFLRVHLSSTRPWSRSGALKAYKVGEQGGWRYRKEDVLSFLYRSANSSPTQACTEGE